MRGIDFEEIYSPVARFETVRVFLTVATQLRWPIFQLDVKSVFLNGDLQEEVFVLQPEGFLVQGCEDKVHKLRKALYGLRQAPRAWYSKVNHYFIQHGFKRSENEPTLYTKKQGSGEFLVVCLYVDDIIYMGLCHSITEEFKNGMMTVFEMADLGFLHYFLGLEVAQMEDGIFLYQKKYA